MVIGEESCVVDEQERHRQINQTHQGGRPGNQPEYQKQGTNAIGQRRERKTHMRINVHQMWEVMHHAGITSQLFDTMFDKDT
jgi:hypothetical protein